MANLKAINQSSDKDTSNNLASQAILLAKDEKALLRNDGIKDEDIKHLRGIIESKDSEIENLESRIKLLKENHNKDT